MIVNVEIDKVSRNMAVITIVKEEAIIIWRSKFPYYWIEMFDSFHTMEVVCIFIYVCRKYPSFW